MSITTWTDEIAAIRPDSHKTRHQDGGADEISATGLSGLLADDQHVLDAEVTAVAVARALFDAHTVLIAIADDTPVALTVGEQTLVGRITGGNIAALTVAQIITLLGGTSRTFHVNAFQYPAPGTDWTPTIYGAYLAASLSAKKVWLPLNFLKAGDIITAYNLVGDAIETNALTLDCKLVQVNKADPLTATDITNGAIVQVTANGNFDVAVNPDDTTAATDKQYLLEITGTTGVGDEIYVIGAEVQITRLI